MDTYTEHDDSGSKNKSEIPKELSVKSGELPIIITEEMKNYLPKDLLENIKKADKVCREMKRNKKNSFEKVVIKRLPHQMTLQSKATTRRRPLECCQNSAAILKLKSPTRKRCSNLLKSSPKTAPMFDFFQPPRGVRPRTSFGRGLDTRGWDD